MIFHMPQWRLVVQHYPLTSYEIDQLHQHITDSAAVAYAVILWGQSIQQRYVGDSHEVQPSV